MSSASVRATVHYSGRVQGVGFRWRVRATAELHPVTGHVANLRDGRVRLVAEGARSDVERFLEDVADRLRAHIVGSAVRWTAAAGGFSRFEIRRSQGPTSDDAR